jgi:hypothetical protein
VASLVGIAASDRAYDARVRSSLGACRLAHLMSSLRDRPLPRRLVASACSTRP